MVSRITAALAARKKTIQEKEKGFTLIELLVVVIIIGVLAAIAIPIYMGVQDNAKNSAVQSDLTNAKIAVVAYQTEAPATALATDADLVGNAALIKNGLTKSADTASLILKTAPTAAAPAFCIIGTRTGDATKTFNVTHDKGVQKGSTCGVNTP